MSNGSHNDPLRRNLIWHAPPLFPTGHRPTNPPMGMLIQEVAGRVLRWTGDEWVDDLPAWLLLQYSRDRDPARSRTDVDRIEQARWQAWELGQRLRDAPSGSDTATDAEQQLRRMAMPYARRDGWHDSWAVKLA